MVSVPIIPITQFLLMLGMGDVNLMSYHDAHRDSLATGKPLLVFVTADWCSACVDVKRNVLPELQNFGALDELHLAQIDYLKQKELAKKLSITKRVPQLILFTKSENGWTRWQLKVGRPVQEIAEFLKDDNRTAVADLPNVRTR